MTCMTAPPTVIVIDDETGSRESMAIAIQKSGLDVETFDDAQKALKFLAAQPTVRVAICDLRMPGMDGLAFLNQVREQRLDLAVMLVTGFGTIESAVEAMRVGADDYLTKPVSPQVIVAHVKAVLRRSGVEESKTLQVDNLTIYEDEYRASLEGKDLGLTLTEFELVRYLVRHPRKAFTRQQLLETIWKDAMMVTERTVDAHIKNLREKLGPFARHIQTVRGVGYRFVQGDAEEEG